MLTSLVANGRGGLDAARLGHWRLEGEFVGGWMGKGGGFAVVERVGSSAARLAASSRAAVLWLGLRVRGASDCLGWGDRAAVWWLAEIG